MKRSLLTLSSLLALTAPSLAQTVSINFDFLPGPDGQMGTADDLPIVAESFYSDTTWQLTTEYASVGVSFQPNPPVNDANEILKIDTFATPPTITAPNLLANRETDLIIGEFSVPVTRVSALIGISNSVGELEIFSATGASLGLIQGDNEIVSLSSTTPIARFEVRPAPGTTGWVAIDNLEFDVEGSGAGTPFCDPANPNSTGQPTILSGTMGSGVGSGLHLEAAQGPAGEFGYFLIGTTFTEPGIPLGQGRLCVSGAIGRYNATGANLNSTGQFDGFGIFQNFSGTATSTSGTGFDVPTTIPTTGSPTIQAGNTYTFQLWHREAGGDSNLSNGLEVVF